MKKHLLLIQSLLLMTALWTTPPIHATAVDVSTPQSAIPPNIITTSNRPMVMLAASKDHSLFGPIYTDFEDLDNDGVIDTTFIPTFKYYGYFDSTKCYDYSTSNGQFFPAEMAIPVPTTVGSNTLTRYTCSSSKFYWSGNFLNWTSMTRLDIIRKILYGGTRSTDTTTGTVLERAKLNYDAHSFVKYYRGDDIRDYTPFTTKYLTKSTGANANVYAGISICNTGTYDRTFDSSNTTANPPIIRVVRGNVRFWATVEIEVCRWRDNYSAGTFGPKLARYYQDADKGNGVVAHELTIPSIATDGASYTSSGSTIGPEMNVRVKVCDPNLLGDEHCQAFPPNSTSNYKPYGLFQEFGYSTTGGAARAEFGTITGSEDLNYTAGALRKNMGDFSDEINSSTGVFCHSASSGCPTNLPSPDGRKTGNGAIKAFDAIVLNDRTSQRYATSGTPGSVSEGSLSSWGNPIGEMLVQALQYFAYDGSNPKPTNPSSTSKDTKIGTPVSAWVDPLSSSNATRTSLYGNSVCRPLETLLLSHSALSFDGQAATAFATLPNTPDITSYTNNVGSAEGFNNTIRSIGSVSGGYGTSCAAKTVNTLSGVSGICPEAPAMGGTYQVAGAALYGNTTKIRNISTPPSDLKYVKDALKVKTLAASLTGGAPRIDILVPGTGANTGVKAKYIYITPESVQGGGGINAPLTFASISSGSTYGAFIVTWNDILMGGDYDMDITGFLRYDLIPSSSGGWDVKVTTDIPGVCGGGAGTHGFSIIGVTGATGTSANGRYLTHQHYSSGILSGMPPTSEYLCGDSTYRAQTSTLFSGTYANTVCNVTGNGATGDPGIPNLPSYCTVKNIDYPVSKTFHMVGETDALIRDPLFYAAKYGSFDSSTPNTDGSGTYTDLTLPPNVSSWDSLNADGTPGSDGVPDGYFLARRPELLEQQLRKALDSLTKSSNAAPVTSSSSLTDGSYVYLAAFDSTTVTGNINAYKLQADGSIPNTPDMQAGQKLALSTSGADGKSGDKGNSRNIITNYGNKSTTVATPAAPFRWETLGSPTLPTGFIAQITTASTNVLSDANAQRLVQYMRGDQSLEGISTGLRSRGGNMLGPIVNATPWVQSAPAANFVESQSPGYRDFVGDRLSRPNLLWAAANDGMLHAFDPLTLAETFAYVPGLVANRLAEIPLQRGTTARTRVTVNGSTTNFTSDATEKQPDGTVWAYVDGNPFTADVKLGITTDSATGVENGGTWYTYLFNALGRGGRGIFALDVSNTKNATSWGNLSEGNANNIFKWQFSADDDVQSPGQLSDLGYIVGDIGINPNTGQANPVVKLNNGKFALLLNNGPQAPSGQAALFLLFIDGPNSTTGKWTQITDKQPSGQYVKIVADVGPNNGLSKPLWIDRDNNGTADVVYAGDLKGNMWKFDISSADPTKWAVAYKSGTGDNRPLFKAQYDITVNKVVTSSTPLPITAAPEYVYPAFDGLIINFGTGNAFATGDFPKAGVQQRFYGIWDRPAFATATGTGPMIASDLSTLVPRNFARSSTTGDVTVSADSTDSSGTPTYASINWVKQDGWYINLPAKSEAVLSDPDLQAGYLVFSSVRPKTDTNVCNSTPDSTLYVVDPIAGRTTRSGLLNSSGITVAGINVGGQKWVVLNDRTTSIRATKSCTAGTSGCVNGATQPTGGTDQICKTIVDSNSGKHTLCYNPLGRVQWREIPGLRTDQ